MVNSAPLARIRCLARLIRCPTVASGTSSARAISPVVRPPTARNVNATCDTAVSDGWQQSIIRYALGRPLLGGGEQRLVNGVLTGVEPAVPAHQRAEDLRRRLPQQILEAAHPTQYSQPLMSSTGRTSTPPYLASGTFAAHSTARSTPSHSTR